MGTLFHVRQGRRGGRFAALFFVMATIAVSFLLWQPLCDAAHLHASAAIDAEACCSSVESTGDEPSALATSHAGAKPLAAGLAPSYLGGAASLLGAVLLFTSAPLPQRSFYARSARILR